MPGLGTMDADQVALSGPEVAPELAPSTDRRSGAAGPR